MTQRRAVVIRRFALGPLAQWGFVGGAVVACLPAFVCSWLGFTLIAALRRMLAGWRDVGIEVLGQRISFNLVEMLNLQSFSQTLAGIAGLGIFGLILAALALALVLGLFGALVMTALGLFYNATGRLQLELEETAADEQPH